MVQGFLAFTLSGLFHSAASYAVDRNFRSAFTAFCIFAMQPVAIIFQLLVNRMLKIARCPKLLLDVLTAAVGFAWLVLTANVLMSTSAFERVLQELSRAPHLL
jgi:hypothetical protein